jgi:alpha-ribazole phosphatase/probable phosphoglycerate mutase
MNEDIVTTVDLLRHGEPEGGNRYRGTLDDPLSSLGWEQMRVAIGDRHLWDAIISSPLRRCADFARELATQLRLRLDIEPDLREMTFGDWEGRTLTEIMRATPQALELFWRDPVNYPPPGGEPLPIYAARVIAAWQTVLERHAGRHVLIVGHGGMIRMVLQDILGMPLQHIWRLEVPYANFSRVRIHGRGREATPLLVFHGKTLE